jgi:hypothetical protein
VSADAIKALANLEEPDFQVDLQGVEPPYPDVRGFAKVTSPEA